MATGSWWVALENLSPMLTFATLPQRTDFGPFSVICAGYYCWNDYYDCGDGSCVPDDTVCDGTENCLNGADEDNCRE